MAVIDMDGFESGINLLQNTSMSGPVAITGRDGVGIGLRASTTTIMTKQFTSGSDQIYFHQGIFIRAAQFGSTANTNQLFSVFTDVGVTAHVTCNISSTGHITLRRGSSSGTILATASLFINSDAWASIEASVLIGDSTGTVIVKVNGQEHINFTGDTKNGGSSSLRPDTIIFGVLATGGIDDWLLCDTTTMINNTWTGEISIVGVRPAANGANSGLTGSDSNSTDNYLLVDENPFNTSDYVGSSTTGLLDTYDMSAVGKVGTVMAVQNIVYAVKSDAGAKSFKHVKRSNSGTTVKSSAVPLSTTYVVYASDIWTTDGDGNDWTVTRVNNHEFGFEVV